MASIAVELPRESIASFCNKWKVRRLALFGSVLRDDFGANSDVDVLVDFDDQAAIGLWDMIAAETELATLFGRPVDLIDRRSVEQSDNWIRRRSILGTARTIYER